jgi:2,5-diketo-D-gluconate reductase A
VPTQKLSNGVEMPVVALGTGGEDNATAKAAVALGLQNGFTHIHTAFDYYNQGGVGDGLRTQPGAFVTTMTSPCIHTAAPPIRNVTDPQACYALTRKEITEDLQLLQVKSVDLLLLHGPAQSYGTQGVCQPDICELTRAQWRAYTDAYTAGQTKAIGVSNFCPSCFECLLSAESTLVPAVNQVQYHVGMGRDPQGLLSYCQSRGIVIQAYSPLASGKLVTQPPAALSAIASARGKSTAAISLRWILQNPTGALTLVTKADKAAYMKEDLDLFSWNLTSAEMAQLDALTSPTDNPSWGCTK